MKRTNEGQLSVFGDQTAGDLISTIERDGYALIDHGASEELVDALIRDYAAFTDNLPDPSLETMEAMIPGGTDPATLEKRLDDLNYGRNLDAYWHKYNTNHPQFAKPGGYTNRSLQIRALREVRGVELADDPKEYYHYHPNSLTVIDQLHEAYGWGPVPSEVKTLHMRFAAIHRAGVAAVTGAYAKLEAEHPDLLSRFATKADLDGSPIRLLFYHPGQGDLLAGGHYDKGLGTLQIAESHRGFRARVPGTNSEEQIAAYRADPLTDPNMQLLERDDPNLGIFFPARAWINDVAYPHSRLEPTWHDVVNLPEMNAGRALHGKNCARWAIIFFTNSRAAGAVTKSQTHNETVLDLSTATLAEADEQVA